MTEKNTKTSENILISEEPKKTKRAYKKKNNNKLDESEKTEKPVVVKKKRGRKPKILSEADKQQIKIPKKRGRKPKGGKIVEKTKIITDEVNTLPNIILHLKCKQCNETNLSELKYNPLVETPESYNINSINKLENLNYEYINSNTDEEIKTENFNAKNNNSEISDNIINENTTSNNSYKELWFKLKELQHNLHTNNISNKHTSCFWCTCEFDNPPIYIPKFYVDNHYEVYGCFCTPECAVSFLMNENIDSSVRFERYQLINHIYGDIYNYTKNIKPAPNPYYLLDKYCGNLSIAEYRSLNANNSLLLVIDKPLTRVMPELHEDNVLSSNIIPKNKLSLKRSGIKKKKSNIMTENFGFAN